ncbi:MAG: PhnD/SsuA/transferrin family substrate-binding protein [Clostridia bacterium]|nr:PhnD/SsuA/transferrin family substrate-binding protein [Clostridia bacterium]
MKKLTKVFALLTAFCCLIGILAGCAGGGQENTTLTASGSPAASETASGAESAPGPVSADEVRVAFLSGSTGLGASKLIVDAKAEEKKTVNRYDIEVIADPSAVIAGLKQGKYDLAALPVNVAAKLWNMPDVDVQLVALNTLGVLYVLENGSETVKSVADLSGKTVYTTGEGATPQYILEYLLKKNGLEAGKDVTVVYRATADEVQADATAEGAVVMLPEPKATVVTKAIATMRYALDVTAEWDKVSTEKLTQGCVVALKTFASEHKDALDAFLEEYRASVEFVAKADDAAAAAVVEAGIIGKAPIAKIAIPKSNLVCMTGAEMKKTMSAMLSVLFESDPKSIGGKLPGDGFYYGQ